MGLEQATGIRKANRRVVVVWLRRYHSPSLASGDSRAGKSWEFLGKVRIWKHVFENKIVLKHHTKKFDFGQVVYKAAFYKDMSGISINRWARALTDGEKKKEEKMNYRNITITHTTLVILFAFQWLYHVHLQEVEPGPKLQCNGFKLWALSTSILCYVRCGKREDKLEFTHEFQYEVVTEHQQTIIYLVTGIKLRIKVKPRDTDFRAS